MKYAVALLGIIILIACGEEQTTNDAKVQVQLDSINQQLLALREQLKSNDNINDTNALKDSSEIPDVPLPPPPPSPLTDDRKKNTAPSPVVGESETAVYYYTGSKKKSVEISPWVDGKRTITLYDPFGKVSYIFSDRNLSYSITTRLVTFHSNGAVQKAVVHNNPGASISWSESQITFSINNEPEWKEVTTYPVELTIDGNPKYYWDKKQQNWVKQEVVHEQPVPQPG